MVYKKIKFLIPQNSGDSVSVSFNEYHTESGYDFLYVYNGMSTTDALFIKCDNSGCLNKTFTAANADGALTFLFT